MLTSLIGQKMMYVSNNTNTKEDEQLSLNQLRNQAIEYSNEEQTDNHKFIWIVQK